MTINNIPKLKIKYGGIIPKIKSNILAQNGCVIGSKNNRQNTKLNLPNY